MIVVIHFCTKDVDLAIKNLNWWIYLDGKAELDCVLSYDDITPANKVAEVEGLASRYFKSVQTFWYPAPIRKTWPYAPNWAWQETARYMAATHSKPWLWLESDAVAIRKGWLVDIAKEHYRVGKAFSGHVVTGMAHVNGVCVYPPIVAQYARDCLHVTEIAWDVVLGGELARDGDLLQHVHPAHTLFQHCWCINPADGKAWNGSGEVATFKSTHDVIRLVDLTMAIFHRCKDGTLIDMLKLHYEHPELAMVPQNTDSNENRGVSRHGQGQDSFASDGNSEAGSRTVSGPFQAQGSAVGEADPIDQAIDKLLAGFKEHESSTATNEGVCSVTAEEAKATTGVSATSGALQKGAIQTGGVAFKGNCEIFIVTYGLPTRRASGLTVSDFDWLAWCLRCIRKFCRGFQGITVVIPSRDAALFGPLSKEHAEAKSGIPLRLRMFAEQEGKGMLGHMVQMASADMHCPAGTTHVLHLDADCMFKEPVTPDEYFEGDKPVYVVRSWESLTDPVSKVSSDCLQWKEHTDNQLGFKSSIYSMLRHPSGFPVEFYKQYRDHVSKVHNFAYEKWMLTGKNEFAQNRMDFTAMGAYAYEMMRPNFKWIDISEGNHLAPKDKLKAYWSHSGLNGHIEAEIGGFIG